MTIDPAVGTALNNTWILVVSFLIFFMHAGFAMLEAGQVRSKNVANQLTKNLLTWAVGVTVFFLLGTGFEGLFSGGGFDPAAGAADPSAYIGWLYGAVFAMTAATIVSGAVAGRAKLRAYVTYTFLLAAVIYPMVTAFTWAAPEAGLVEQLVGTPFKDFAGGMIVHGMGGIAGLTAAAVLGPRLERYAADGSTNVIPGHSMTFAVLGTLILSFGWFGFNVGTGAIVNDENLHAAASLGSIAMGTSIAMACGGLGAGLVAWLKSGKVDTLYVANGFLAGLVGITAIPDTTVWWGAIVVGGLAGAQLPLVFEFVSDNLKIDDVCAVFPVHGSAGVLGTLLFPFVALPGAAPEGIGAHFLAQLTGVVIIGGWTLTATAVVWYALKTLGEARVSSEHEQAGLDITEHGVETYPEFGSDRVATDGSGRREGTAADGGDGQLRTDGGGSPDLKLVTAVLRPEKLGDVKTALANVGAPSLTVTNVSGRGSQPSKKGSWRGEEYTIDLHQKVKVECVVADVSAEKVAEAMREAANTGEPGDGKIFIIDVENAIQVRTGKEGPEAV